METTILSDRTTGKTRTTTITELDGLLDEFRVWDHARTEEQIRSNMFSRLSGDEEGLFGYWNFDKDSAADASPNKFHGEMVGGATTVELPLPTLDSVSRDGLSQRNHKHSSISQSDTVYCDYSRQGQSDLCANNVCG